MNPISSYLRIGPTARDRIQKIKVRNIRLLSMQYDAADFSEQNDTSIIHIGQREV